MMSKMTHHGINDELRFTLRYSWPLRGSLSQHTVEAEALSFPCFQMFNSEISHPLCCQAHVLSAPPICRPPCELLLDFQISRLFGGLYKGFAFCTAGLFGFKTVAAAINGREGGDCLICSILSWGQIPLGLRLQWRVSIHSTAHLRWSPPVRGIQVWEWTQVSPVGEQANAFRFFYAWKRRFRSVLSLSLQNKWCVLCEQPPVPDLTSWFRNYAAPAK